MKKKLLFTLTVVFVFLLGTVIGTTATYSKTITAWFYNISVNLDGVPMHFKSQPFIYNGHVYVSVNDLANNMGMGIQWDDKQKTLDLSSRSNNQFGVNTLTYQLEKKNLEIANLKFQLSQKQTQLDILNDEDTYSYDSDTLDDLEELLEDEYDHHRNNGRSMDFDDYSVYELSDDTIRIRMYGDFDRSSREWDDRDDSDFEDFIEDICEEIDDEVHEDIEIIIYDDDRDKIAEYTYDSSSNELDEDYTYGDDDNDKLDDLEDELERNYDEHKNNNNTLKFDNYELSQQSDDDIKVKMYGDFDRYDDKWQDLDESDFDEFIEDICDEISSEFDEDIEISVYDEDNHEIAEYVYDESKSEFTKDELNYVD